MSHSSRYVKGQWVADCDRCGFTYLAEELKLEWDGFMVCPKCWEPRQPQDFVRAKVDIQAPPWTRPEPIDKFTNLFCTPEGSSSYPALAMPGCAVPGKDISLPIIVLPGTTGEPAVTFYSFCTLDSVRCLADHGGADCMTVGKS